MRHGLDRVVRAVWLSLVVQLAVAAPSVAVAQQAPPVDEPAPPPPGTFFARGVPIKLTSSMFTRYELRQNYDALGVSGGRFTEGDAIFYRARLGIKVGEIDLGRGYAASMQFTPQATGFLGALPSTIADARLGLYEGYLRLKNDTWALDAGRFMMNYGDSLVIGSLDWHETARSFDGARARITPGSSGAWLDVFFTFLNEGWPVHGSPYGAGDTYFMGLYADVGPALAKGLALDLYALGQLLPETRGLPVDANDPASPLAARASAFEVTLGARAKQRIGAFDYRAEGGVQLGSRPATPGAEPTSVFAYQIDAEAGVHLASDRVRLGVEALYASGDDQSTSRAEGWNQLYPTAHKFLGLSDAFGARTNAASGVLHLAYKPVKGLVLGLDAHVLARPVATAGGASGYAASELDVGASYDVGRGFIVRGLYGLFIPNGEVYPSSDPLHYLEVEMRYDFR
jgi:hypothetical protein